MPTTTAECGCPGNDRANLTRRSFLGLVGAAGFLTATTMGNARVAFGSPSTSTNVVVIVSLRGGFDGLSAIVPAGEKAYYETRPNIAVPAATLHMADSMFGLAPAMKPLYQLWDSGQLAAVHAVGQSDPTRSHFEAMAELERAAPGSHLRTGWLDRAIGVSGTTNVLAAAQVGNPALPASLYGDHAKFAIRSLAEAKIPVDEKVVTLATWRSTFNTLYQGSSIGTPMQQAVTALTQVRSVANTKPDTNHAAYPGGELGKALADVAALVRANVGMRFATIDVGDWDMHQNLGRSDGGWMNRNLTDLSGSLAAFAADLGDDLNRVTVVTISEFGRRVAENGSGGLDHGHGNCVLVLGGGVKGGKVYGRWPGLGASALDQGDLAATTDYRSIMAEILTQRSGVSTTDTIFPGFRPTPLGAVAA